MGIAQALSFSSTVSNHSSYHLSFIDLYDFRLFICCPFLSLSLEHSDLSVCNPYASRSCFTIFLYFITMLLIYSCMKIYLNFYIHLPHIHIHLYISYTKIRNIYTNIQFTCTQQEYTIALTEN